MPKKPKWNEIPCPECKEPVAADATRCPHCQTVFSEEQREDRKKQFATSQKFGFGCLAIVIVFLLFTCSGGDEEGTAASKLASGGTEAASGNSSDDNSALEPAVISFNDSIMAAVAPCDQAGSELATVAEGFSTGDTGVYEGYSASKKVEDSCRQSWEMLGDIDLPSAFEGKVEELANETLETCRDAMLTKQMGGATMAEVFDGDMRPSKMEEATELAEAASSGQFACIAEIFGVAGEAGVDPERLAE